MRDPETWRWIWFVGSAIFAVGEMVTVSFFMLPFAIGAAVASALAFAGVELGYQWMAFIATSAACYAGMRPFARRLNESGPSSAGIGSKRLIDESGMVLEDIAAGVGEVGVVRVQREEWRAESADASAMAARTPVRIIDVRGTHLVVEPLGSPESPESPGAPGNP
jgi:membrane protein implicated in regulation of membrane protease activity